MQEFESFYLKFLENNNEAYLLPIFLEGCLTRINTQWNSTIEILSYH